MRAGYAGLVVEGRAAISAASAGAVAPRATRATVPSRNFFISLFSNRSFPRRRVPAPSMAGVSQLLPKMLSPRGHSEQVPNLLMELGFRILTDALIKAKSGLNRPAPR